MKEVSEEELDNLGMRGWYRTIVTDYGSNVVSAFDRHRGWDWLRCRCHLLHNIVMGSLQVIKNMSHTGEHTPAGRIQRALDRYGKCNYLYACPLLVLQQVSVPQGMYGDLKSSYGRKGSQSCLYWVGLLLACFPFLFSFHYMKFYSMNVCCWCCCNCCCCLNN